MAGRFLTGLLVSGFALLVAACTTPTPYKPAAGGYGYSEPVLADGIYRISFHGNSVTPKSTVESYLLRRMAELTLAEGHTYFSVVEAGTDCLITVRTSPTSTCTVEKPHSDNFPYYTLERDPRWFWQRGARREYEATAFFVMQDDAAPIEGGQTYMAGEIAAHYLPSEP